MDRPNPTNRGVVAGSYVSITGFSKKVDGDDWIVCAVYEAKGCQSGWMVSLLREKDSFSTTLDSDWVKSTGKQHFFDDDIPF